MLRKLNQPLRRIQTMQLQGLNRRFMSAETVKDAPPTEAEPKPTEPKVDQKPSEPEPNPAEIESLNLKIQTQEKELADLKDLYRRAVAETENVRQRSIKELREKQEFAIQKFAKDLLETADVLTLALDSVPEAQRGEKAADPVLKNLYVGVDMTRKSLLKTFADHGIVGYHPMGHDFDFNLHTAIFQAPMPNMKPGTVFHVDKIGYMFKNRVLRSAQVGVVMDPSN